LKEWAGDERALKTDLTPLQSAARWAIRQITLGDGSR
jgi:hypothetical protein